MSKQLLVLNTAADLLVYRAGAAIALSAIAVGDKEIAFSDQKYTTLDLDSKEIHRAALNAFNAGTAQVATVTLGANVAGVEHAIGIHLTTIGVRNAPRDTFYGLTAAAVAAAITADGAKSDSAIPGFTASASGQVVTITAPLNNTFRLFSPTGGVIAYTVAMVPTTGRAVDVAKLEEYCLPYMGATNKVGFPVTKTPSKVTTGATYDVIVAECYPVANAKDRSARKSEQYRLYIAVNKTIVAAGSTATDILAGLVKLT